MIIFYVASLDVNLASVRYRALLPAYHLNRRGIQAKVCTGVLPSSVLKKATCLILVKAFNARALRICANAHTLNLPVIVDLCDDIFEEEYGANIGRAGNKSYFKSMAAIASSITTTTQVLADRIRQFAPPGMTVHVVPDMVESLDDVRSISASFPRKGRRASLRNLYRRIMRCGKTALRPAAKRETQKTGSGQEKTLLWFGNHGAAHSDSGMLQLLWMASDLRRLAKEFPLRLVIISNSHAAFDRFIAPLPLKTEYIEWTPEIVYRELPAADVCLVPFGRDKFSQAKSPNRVILSLSLGVPVVSSDLPSLGPLRDVVAVENWYTSIRDYLTDPAKVSSALMPAQKIIAEHYSPQAVTEQWRNATQLARKRSNRPAGKPTLLCLVQLVQDIDLLRPIIKASVDHFDVKVAIHSKLALTASSTLDTLRQYGSRSFFFHADELATSDGNDPRFSADVVLTASETSARPHRVAQSLVHFAKRHGVPSVTLQHGIENIGLTYRDAEYTEDVRFLSDYIFIWGDDGNLPDWVSPETRSKVLSVGSWKEKLDESSLHDFPLFGTDFIAVLENLHWSRYDDTFRERFVADLQGTAEAFPEQLFVLKPHGAGQWFTGRRKFAHALPDNVLVIDPEDEKWARFTADAFLARAKGAITTPSTTAFDATRYGTAIAVVTYGIDASLFQSLPRLSSEEDWHAFVRDLGGRSATAPALDTFRRSVAVRENAVGNVVAALLAIAQGEDRAKVKAFAHREIATPGTSQKPAALVTTLHPIVDDLSDSELSELNSIVPWHAWIVDGRGRGFGSKFSGYKRASPDAFPDPRIVELDRLVPLRARSVLEVGCFEGIHTAALCAFAQNVKACDVRIALVVKTAVRCAFMGARPELFVWNGEAPLPDRNVAADVLHHVGVLYHLKDPVTHLNRLLPNIGQALLLDTHVAVETDTLDNFEVDGRVYRTRRYREGGIADPFSGVHEHSNWLLLDDLIGLLSRHGFEHVLVNRVSEQRNGPRVTIVARKLGVA